MKNALAFRTVQAAFRLRAEIRVRRWLRRDPILVYTMGKVGSTSIVRSLDHAGLAHRTMEVHMTAGLLDRAVADHRAVGRQSVHLATGAALRAHMDRLRSNGCSIVTLVRDPIAREVSNAFQTPELVGLDGRDASRDPAEVVALLRRRLMEDGPILYMESWFGQELELATGVNVFDYPFDMQRGWSIIERNGIRLLLLRVEDLTSQGPAALGSLLGSDVPLGVVDGNVRAATADGEIYGSVRQRLRLPADLVERIYGSSFMRHFYSESTLADFARQWSDDA